MSSTEQRLKELEAELAKAREMAANLESEVHMFRNFMNNVPDAVYFKDADSRFITLSHSLATKHGMSVENLIGKTDHDLFKAEHADEARADEVRVMETGEPLVGDREHELFNNEEDMWCITHKMALKDHDENITGTFGISYDVTRQVELEQEREKLIAQLQEALTQIKQLDGLMPICSYCKKIRDDEGYWQQMEEYISTRTEARFSHGMCEGCAEDYIRKLEETDLNPDSPKK